MRDGGWQGVKKEQKAGLFLFLPVQCSVSAVLPSMAAALWGPQETSVRTKADYEAVGKAVGKVEEPGVLSDTLQLPY